MHRVLIIGATSAIAEAAARIYATRGDALYLLGRNATRLEQIAADLCVRGSAVACTGILDVNNVAAHAAALDHVWDEMGGVDVVLIAHGTLPDQSRCQTSVDYALQEFATNCTSTIALATALVPRLRPGSTLAVISSVAGDRGRASNYLYGSAKAAVTSFLSGLGQSLRSKNVNVLTIKPGFVDTPMTRDFKKGPLWAAPSKVAAGIVKAIDRRSPVAYLPSFWWAIMQVIKTIPEAIFRRVPL